MTVRTWRTDEPCPCCSAAMFLLEGLSGLAAECRLCGYSVTLASDDTADWR